MGLGAPLDKLKHTGISENTLKTRQGLFGLCQTGDLSLQIADHDGRGCYYVSWPYPDCSDCEVHWRAAYSSKMF